MALQLLGLLSAAAASLASPPPVHLLSAAPARLMVQRATEVTVVGSGFAKSALAQCRLAPSAYGASDGTTWGWTSVSELVFANLTVHNDTHASCYPPPVLVEGPGTLSATMDGKNFSAGLRIDYVNLVSVALGRRPYITESAGQLVFRSDPSLAGVELSVAAGLPSVPGKSWQWRSVAGGA